MAIRIEQVDAGSEAEALGLAPGDELLSVDDNELNDTLDYDFYTDSSSFHLKARVADGIREWEVQRPQRGPFGCGFKTYLGDAKHSCSNHCMFCFIDQLPPGMRESLYFKDDDERLSFLFGNYITMTNMQDHEIDRIIKMHISPINISVHTTNPQLRVRMLANKRGGEVLKYLPRLVEGGIAVNCQLVLCRGVNDGDELLRDIISGIIVAIIALPLSIALAIASGVGPEQGLYTAIIAGFFISFFGGSRVQIGGPTAAFVVIIYGIVTDYGTDGAPISKSSFNLSFAVILLKLFGSVPARS